MKKIPAPRVDDVCQRIRDRWEHLQFCKVHEHAHLSQASSPDLLEHLEKHTRERLIVDTMRNGLALLTPAQVEWVAAPRDEDRFLPNLDKGVRIDPSKGLADVPEAMRQNGTLICFVWGYALPADTFRYLPEPEGATG